MPPEIEIDMFEVQLGASVLLRMKDSFGSIVTVLADGGIKAKGYAQDHVATKLKGTSVGTGSISASLSASAILMAAFFSAR